MFFNLGLLFTRKYARNGARKHHFPQDGEGRSCSWSFLGGEACRGFGFSRLGLVPAGASSQVTQLPGSPRRIPRLEGQWVAAPGPGSLPLDGSCPAVPRLVKPWMFHYGLKTARRPLKGEVFPCLGAAASPRFGGPRDRPRGLRVTRAGAGPPPAAPRTPSASGGSAPPATPGKLFKALRRYS